MKKYVALLRGINISGKNKIAMPALKEAFEELGFTEVKTYINSGNVVFSSDSQDKTELTIQCKTIIAEKFSLDIPVTIVRADELATILENAPAWWNLDKTAVNYVIFPIAPISVAEIFAEMGEIKPEFEQIAHFGEFIFWSAPRATFSKARWSKIASSAVNKQVTIRNANTVNKIFVMMQ